MTGSDAAENQPEGQKFDPVAEAKRLLRTTRWASLATLVPELGSPSPRSSMSPARRTAALSY